MDGWMDGWTHACMDAWMHGCMDALMHGCMDACMHACMDRRCKETEVASFTWEHQPKIPYEESASRDSDLRLGCPQLLEPQRGPPGDPPRRLSRSRRTCSLSKTTRTPTPWSRVPFSLLSRIISRSLAWIFPKAMQRGL